MKWLFLLYALCPTLLWSQTAWSALDTMPAGTSHIQLPAIQKSSAFSGREYIITGESQYKALFPDSVQERLAAIDFNRYELFGKTVCEQCRRVCGNYPQCHRNACHYSLTWFLLDKQQRIHVPADTLNTENCMLHLYPQSTRVCRHDTDFNKLKRDCSALKNASVDFDTSVVLARTAFVDCNADIRHDLYMDTLNHCIVWRMYIADGGCHGMQERASLLVIPKPPEGYRILFEEYQVDEQ